MTSIQTPLNACVIYLVWGDRYASEVIDAIHRSPGIAHLPKFLITDEATVVPDEPGLTVIRADFLMHGMHRKAEMGRFLPDGYEDFLFLDPDTWVLGDVSLAFEKARTSGFSLVQANAYLLDQFKNFSVIMEKEGVAARGLPQHNAGVIFFHKSEQTMAVHRTWQDLCFRWQDDPIAKKGGDQHFLNLALELNDVTPYTLVRNYNYRANRDPILGEVRIWHWSVAPPGNVNTQWKSWRRFDPKKNLMVPLKKKTLQRRLADTAIRWAIALLRREKRDSVDGG